MKKTLFLSALAVILILSVAVSSVLVPAVSYVPTAHTESTETTGSVDFPLELLRKCYSEGENIIVSPLCASASMAAAGLGASGDTRTQLENVLCSGGDLNLYASFLGSAMSDSDCVLSVWVSDDGRFTLDGSYADSVKDNFSAKVFSADFGTALDSMNGWVQSATDGRIESIIDDIPPEAVMYILSALAFDGEWTVPYSSEKVTEGEFTGSDGTVYTASFMNSVENVYLESDNCTGFAKPYSDGSYFVALLPDEGVSVSAMLASLDSKAFGQIMSGAQQKSVTAILPKFEAESRLSLVNAMISMGAEDAFSKEKADFSAMGSDALYITDFLLNCTLSVDESGTTAGAASGIEVSLKGMPSVSVVLNRPFAYFIVKNGEILFAGVQERI